MANGNKTDGNAIEAAERQRQALELRKAGATFQVIADQLGYAGPQGAHEAVRKAIAAIPRQEAEEVRAIELERLDRMQLGLYDKAKKGHEGAVDRMLRIMDRRAKLLGLDAPQKVAPTNPDGTEEYAGPLTDADRAARTSQLLAEAAARARAQPG